jgi:hypothetical protein
MMAAADKKSKTEKPSPKGKAVEAPKAKTVAPAPADAKTEAKAETKSENKNEIKSDTKAETPSETKTESKPDAAPSKYHRGEGQKPVTQEYKDNWNAIFAKKKKR